jgi:hypothetical protein
MSPPVFNLYNSCRRLKWGSLRDQPKVTFTGVLMFLVSKAILDDMLHAALHLRGALGPVNDAALPPALDGLLRRVFVANVLAQKWVVAIGGAQGAGKTTLVCQLYSLDSEAADWLPANEGQGERLPVLVQETADVSEPQGWVYRLVPPNDARDSFSVREEPVEVAQFHEAARGDNPSFLLPVLKVPPRHFQAAEATLLLLPGYEHRHRQNAVWQELMREALASAGACVIVTDQTRLANSNSQDILRDHELSGTEPVVVITKTEEADEALRDELCRRAAEVFKGSGGQAASVICTGLGAAFTEDWSRKLVEEIKSAANTASSVQEVRVQHLTTLLDELRELLTKVKDELAAGHDNADDAWERVIWENFAPYDKAVDKLRQSYLKQLDKALAAHRDEARKHLLGAIKPDEGFSGWLSGKFRTTSERLERQRELIEQAWRAPGDCQECHFQALTYATFDKLRAPGLAALPRQTFGRATALIARTGYEGELDDPESTLPKTAENLKILLTTGDGRGLNKSADNDMALLPALALEFSRLVQLAAVNHQAPRTAPKDGITAPDAAGQLKTDFMALMGIHNEVVGAISTVFGVKKDEDIHTLINATRANRPKGKDAVRVQRVAGSLLLAADLFFTGLGTAAALAAAVVAVNMLVRAAEKEQLGQAEAALDALAVAYREAYLSSFNEITEKVRDRMTEVLRARYNLDQRVYERDRLALAARRLQSAVDSLDSALPRLT